MIWTLNQINPPRASRPERLCAFRYEHYTDPHFDPWLAGFYHGPTSSGALIETEDGKLEHVHLKVSGENYGYVMTFIPNREILGKMNTLHLERQERFKEEVERGRELAIKSSQSNAKPS